MDGEIDLLVRCQGLLAENLIDRVAAGNLDESIQSFFPSLDRRNPVPERPS